MFYINIGTGTLYKALCRLCAPSSTIPEFDTLVFTYEVGSVVDHAHTHPSTWTLAVCRLRACSFGFRITADQPTAGLRMGRDDEEGEAWTGGRVGWSRQDYLLLVPAALSLATGTAILRNTIMDDRVYDERHKQVFSVLQVRRAVCRRFKDSGQAWADGCGRRLCVWRRSFPCDRVAASCPCVIQSMQAPKILEIGIGGGANMRYFPQGSQVR
jgi:hypothetical protein